MFVIGIWLWSIFLVRATWRSGGLLEDGTWAPFKVCRTRGLDSFVSLSAFWQKAAFVIAYLRKDKTLPSSKKRTKVEETPQQTRWEKEGRRCFKCQIRIPWQLVERTPPEQISTLLPVEHHMVERTDMPWRNCSLWRAHAGASFSWGTAGPTLCSRGRGRSSREELLWTDNNSTHTPLGAGRRYRNREWSEAEPWKKGEGGRCYRFCLCFSPFNSILIVNKLIFPNLFCPWWFLVSDHRVFVSIHKLLILFPPPNPVEEQERMAGWVSGSWLRLPTIPRQFFFLQFQQFGQKAASSVVRKICQRPQGTTAPESIAWRKSAIVLWPELLQSGKTCSLEWSNCCFFFFFFLTTFLPSLDHITAASFPEIWPVILGNF